MKTRWMKKALALVLVIMMLAGSAAAAADEAVSQKLSTYYSLAIGYLNREDYDKAMEYLDGALKICAEETNGDMYADLHLKKACVYTIRQEYPEALTELEESLRVRPEVAETYLVRVQVYNETNEIAKATADLEKYIELSGDASMNDTLAQLYLQLEDREKAEESYRSLAEATTDDPDLVVYNLAVYEINAQMYAEALANLQSCAENPEKYPARHYNTGICQMMLGNYAEAVEAFTASLESENLKQDAVYNRAVCNMTLQVFDSAIEDFTAYINDRNAEVLSVLPTEGENGEAAEETAEAETAEEQTANITPDIAYYYRGLCYISTEKYTEAAADFTVCLDNDINVNESRFNRALSLLQSGNYEGAKADFTDSVENGYMVDEALFYRSYAYVSLGENDAALADLTTCIEHEYDLGQSYNLRAQVYQIMGDDDHYLQDLEASLAYLDD